jgi:regulator of replication initiation timing
LRKQIARLLAENTQMNKRSTEIKQQTGKMNEQIARLFAENTQLRQQTAV